jgi:hypothetical protein
MAPGISAPLEAHLTNAVATPLWGVWQSVEDNAFHLKT